MPAQNKETTPVIATVERLSHDGRGVTTVNNKITFVRGALPGERVSFQILKKHRNYAEANVVDVITPSPDRVTAKCPHFLVCGGCNCQHMPQALQLREKQKAVLDQFQHIAKLVPLQILTPLQGPQWGYRHKARLGVRFVDKKGKMLIGFREYQGRYLADLSGCETLHPMVGKRFEELAELVHSLQDFYDIPQLEVAIGDDVGAIIVRHLKPLTDHDLQLLKNYSIKTSLHIYLQPGNVESIFRLYPTAGLERLHYELPQFSLNFAFHPADFTQVNPHVNRQMVSKAIELLDVQPHENVLDLFCGLGNFTLPIAKFAKRVTGVEGSERMVLRAQENAHSNNVTNTDFYSADLTTDMSHATWAQHSFDKALLDPPRSGAQEIIPMIIGHAKRIVYVSCNPATLARDAGILVHRYGYRLSKFLIIDMFPNTSHIESMAVFDHCGL